MVTPKDLIIMFTELNFCLGQYYIKELFSQKDIYELMQKQTKEEYHENVKRTSKTPNCKIYKEFTKEKIKPKRRFKSGERRLDINISNMDESSLNEDEALEE